jgi:hypothetical protein
MRAVFVELPAFARHRGEYLDDEGLRLLQVELLAKPDAGTVIDGTGGLRKMRYADVRRGKGKRGGLRVIYFFRSTEAQFWLFTVYDKDEMDELDAREKRLLRQLLKLELDARR